MDAADPETFITAVAAVLSDYPANVVNRVTDPRTGLPGKQAFPPSPFEVKQACEIEMAPMRRQMEREHRFAATRALLPPPVEGPRPTTDELKEKLGPTWGIHGGDFGVVSRLSPEAEKTAAQERLAELAAEAAGGLHFGVSDELQRRIDALAASRPHPIAAE